MQILYLCVTVVSAILLQTSYSSAIAYEWPESTAAVCLLVCALCTYIASRYHSQILCYGVESHRSHDSDSPQRLQDVHERDEDDLQPIDSQKNHQDTVILILAVAILVVRIELFRWIRVHEECAGPSYQAFVPLILSIYDWQFQVRLDTAGEDFPDSSVYDEIQRTISSFIQRPKWRYTTPILLLSCGCYAVAGFWQGQTSTVICSISAGSAAWAPRLQLLSMLMDCMLAIIADQLARRSRDTAPFLRSTFTSIYRILNGACVALLTISLSVMLIDVRNASFPSLSDFPRPTSIPLSMLWQAVLSSGFLVPTLINIEVHGILPVSVLLAIVLSLAPSVRLLWSARQPYPPIDLLFMFSSYLLIFLGLWYYVSIRRAASKTESRRSGSGLALTATVLVLALLPSLLKPSSVYFHPIDLLMYDARNVHDQYLKYATASNTLNEAARIYRVRYQSNPPPAFDAWWNFVFDRNATLTDDFDQIYLDLLPFRSASPADLRRQTQELLSEPGSEIYGIKIRDGQANLHSEDSDSENWELLGTLQMINKFAKYLPDMDIALNLLKTPRCIPSYETMSRVRQDAVQTRLRGDQLWSHQRHSQWSKAIAPDNAQPIFQEPSGQNDFQASEALSCPDSSPARLNYVNEFQPYTCIACLSPHSIGHFVSNWSLARNPCHQPDLAQLYEPYLSSNTPKITHHLRPIFSNSKILGYGDILYPSARDYLDMIMYNHSLTINGSSSAMHGTYPDLDLRHKLNSLYWRGGTIEGGSRGKRLWRGMMRPRLVHMANNLTNSFHDHVTLLLPEPRKPGKYSYQTFSASEFLNLGLKADVHIEDRDRVQCTNSDCTEQESELGVMPRTDFQNHWKYRFLFDLDTTGSTGHMIPFLKSHSVPFKAGLHREWFDNRLTPWRHFVPQDIRLHGLWSTLAYFAGVSGSGIGTDTDADRAGTPSSVQWEPHLREAELIAEEGRDWANKVLRKEDMEIYMFRLLLEWARLTDDRRDELGFAADLST